MRYLVIDVGGTFIKYAMSDEEGNLQAHGKVNTPYENQQAFYDCIVEIYDKQDEHIDGVAISMPGTIHTDSGYVHQGGSLQYNNNTYPAKDLSKLLGIPVTIGNDAKCAGMAEVYKGNMKGIKDGLVLVFGTGLGGCLIKDYKVHQGYHYFAGEMSCLITKDIKSLGIRACLGAQAGIPNLVEKVAKAKDFKGEVDGKTLFAWLEAKDEIALTIMKEYCFDMAVQIYNMQMMYDPQCICIGGGVSTQPLFLGMLQEAVDAFYQMLPPFLPKPELTTCRFFNDSNLIGALYWHLQTSERSA